MKDCRGREIAIGSVVVYPGRASSSLWLNVAQVVGIDHTLDDGLKRTTLRVRREKDNKLARIDVLWRVAVVV